MKIRARNSSVQMNHLLRRRGNRAEVVADEFGLILYTLARGELDMILANDMAAYAFLLLDRGQDFEVLGEPLPLKSFPGAVRTSGRKGAKDVREDYALFQRELQIVGEAWNEKANADQQAWALWKRLHASLQDWSNAVSSEEFQRAQAGMESLKAEARKMTIGFYTAVIFLVCIVLGAVILLHRHVLSPISLMAGEMRQIRFGRPSMPLSPARIREVQPLLDLLPSLNGYLAGLVERSGELEQKGRNTRASAAWMRSPAWPTGAALTRGWPPHPGPRLPC